MLDEARGQELCVLSAERLGVPRLPTAGGCAGKDRQGHRPPGRGLRGPDGAGWTREDLEYQQQ